MAWNRQCDYFNINDDIAECVLKAKMVMPSDCEFCDRGIKENEDGVEGGDEK